MAKHAGASVIVDANFVANSLGVSPLYQQQDSERWNAAAQVYRDMMHHQSSSVGSNQTTPDSTCSPEQHVTPSGTGPMNIGLPRDAQIFSFMRSTSNPSGYFPFSPPMTMSLNEVSSRNRSYHGTNHGSASHSRGEQSSLELEAIAAVHELSFAVQTISVSEMLPRTSELIFVNVTTVEGQPYCLELTMKGWRVTSLRQDCMNGDFRRMDLHTKYFESPYQLMDTISPGYRDRFGEKLAARLRMLAVDGEEGCLAPASSYVQAPIFPEEMDSPDRICSPTTLHCNTTFPQHSAPTPIVTVRHPSGPHSSDPHHQLR